MIPFTGVPKLYPQCQKILPTVYDDSLSYYEFLNKVSHEVNTLIDNVNSFFEWASNHEVEYDALVKRVEAVENEINTFETHIETEFAQLSQHQEEQFAEQTARLDAKLLEFQREIERTLADLRNQFAVLKANVETDISNMEVQIQREIAYLNELIDANNAYIIQYVERRLQEFIDHFPELADVPVYNPIRGETTTLQRCINDMYSVACVNGITAFQFDALGLTASEFDALDITAQEFDQFGYIKLGYPDERWYMLSPFTGEYTLVQNVVNQLARFHMTGLTATEYDALNLTADDFDATDITAFNFDWFGKDILTA